MLIVTGGSDSDYKGNCKQLFSVKKNKCGVQQCPVNIVLLALCALSDSLAETTWHIRGKSVNTRFLLVKSDCCVFSSNFQSLLASDLTR